MMSPKESAKLIARNPKHARINEDKDSLYKLGDILIKEVNKNNGKLTLDNLVLSKFHPKSDDSHALEWIFVLHCLTFSIWSDYGKRSWRVGRNEGYFAVCAAINRAITEKVDILNPEFYSKITKQELKNVLRGEGNIKIPLLFEKMKSLNDAGEILIKHFGGSFRNCVEQADHSAITLLTLIVEKFKFFRDEAEYNSSKVSFYKKAQRLIAEIWICFNNQGIGHFHDINELTMGACYRIPQTLLYYNVLQYSDELWQKIKSHINLKNGSEEEVEIRGCSVYAVELLNKYVNEQLQEGKTVNCILIDHFLWYRRKMLKKEIKQKGFNHHQTRCDYY